MSINKQMIPAAIATAAFFVHPFGFIVGAIIGLSLGLINKRLEARND